MSFGRMRRLLVCLLLIGAATARPLLCDEQEPWTLDDFGPSSLRFGGTLKVLGIGYRLPQGPAGERSFEQSGQVSLRLKLEGSPRAWFGYEVHLLLEGDAYSAPSLKALRGSTETATTLFRGLGLEASWAESRTRRLLAEVDYANVRLTLGNADLVIGRQAVTFGRSFFWNPTDWLATFSPNEIDREYKGGVDVARASLALGRFSGVELVYAFGEHGAWDESALIGRAYANGRGWDLEVLGGSVWIDTRLGLAFSGDVGGAGVRGEASWHHPRESEQSNFLRATLEIDYRWASSLQLVAELHHNGFGTTRSEEYASLLLSPRIATAQVSNVGRDYAASQLSYEFTPLLTGTAAALVNLRDGSGLFNPTIALSLSDESDLVAGALVPWGAAPDGGTLRSEYGSYPQAYWIQWRWSF